MLPLQILGSLGGIVAFCTAIYVIAKGLFEGRNATKENTKALTNLATKVDENTTGLSRLTERVSFLEGKVR